jgi:DNA-binding response OmpR family regulator
MTVSLDRLKVLVVEDEYLVSALIKEMLELAGCIVVGPVPRLSDALDAVDHESCDAAVLDVNLAGERVDPVAEALSARDVPFMFLTGYSTGVLPAKFDHRPLVRKPFRMNDLIGTLATMVRPRNCHARPA